MHEHGLCILLSMKCFFFFYFQNATGVSDYAISFGNIDSRKQGGIEYFVYHMIPAGIRFDMESLTDET